MMSSLYVQLQESSMVPFIGAVLVASHLFDKAALEAISNPITEKLDNSLYTSFCYQIIKNRNIPLKPSKIEIFIDNSPNPKTCIIILTFQRRSFTRSSLLCLSETLKCFLHACTPERRTLACAHLFTQRKHGHTPDTKKHILQKNLQGAETLGNDTSGGASKPHRSKYIASAPLFCSFSCLRRSCSWKAW
jgi:hypothetical protein